MIHLLSNLVLILICFAFFLPYQPQPFFYSDKLRSLIIFLSLLHNLVLLKLSKITLKKILLHQGHIDMLSRIIQFVFRRVNLQIKLLIRDHTFFVIALHVLPFFFDLLFLFLLNPLTVNI